MAKAPRKTQSAKESVSKSFRDYNLKRDVDGKLQKYHFVYPGEGDTGQFLMVRSQHCKEYRDAELRATRQISALMQANGNDPSKVGEELLKDIRLRAFCKLIDSWSFEEELNDDNLLDFFAANEFAYEDINVLAAQDSLFLQKAASN